MMYVNGISGLLSFATLLATGTLSPALAFIQGHPAFIADAMIFNASAITGQWFIISQVKEFGALVYAATMNVRQVVSILVSYATYHHTITSLQVLGLVLVFGALLYKSFAGLQSESVAAEKKPLLQGKDEVKDQEAGIGHSAVKADPVAKLSLK